ncbi:MAG: BrnT family toxin [Desulfuromonadales bacterium]|nr:MAG: BrnT family toxin [Desulfuromonadales bacterium]
MKSINWNSEKNMGLKTERGVSFEEALVSLSTGGLLDVVEHPNKEKYPNQRIFVIRIRGYAYLVPFVETEEEIFLKTIIPSRSATRRYIKEEKSNEKKN